MINAQVRIYNHLLTGLHISMRTNQKKKFIVSVKGSCLCGGIRYEIDAELGEAMFCHGGKCRKANGSAFALNLPVNITDFKLISGEKILKGYTSSEDTKRFFCSECGSPIYSQLISVPNMIRIRVGIFDDDVEIKKWATFCIK